jgi:hypothetical protein
MSCHQNAIEHEDEISQLFKNAIIKIDEIDKQAKKEKKSIVKDLARDLEGKIRQETICIEIVNQLCGRVSERFIRECLEDKYKQQSRANNAKKQKEVYAYESYDDLAAVAPLKQQGEYAKNTKQTITIPSSQAESIEGRGDALPLTSITTQQASVDRISGQNRVGDAECESCKDKAFTIHELREALSGQTTLVTAEKISTSKIEFKIPKEKYQHLNDAMKKSKDLVFIIFGKSGVFEYAVPDTFLRKQTCASQ